MNQIQHTFGITGQALSWLKSYINEQSQFIRFVNRQSASKSCEFGVPQGSALGPLLFTLYVTSITNAASFSISHSQYADDSQLYIALNHDNAMQSLSDCFNNVHRYFSVNGLSLNLSKSEAIVIGTDARQRSEGSIDEITVGNTIIRTSESVKSLGVIIDTCCHLTLMLTVCVKQHIFTCEH